MRAPASRKSAEAVDIRLTALQFGGIHPLEFDLVQFRALHQTAHALQFEIVGCNQQLSASQVGNAMFVAECLGGLRAAAAKVRFQAAWGVIDTGVNDAAIVSRLVMRQAGFLLQ
jgi:hypothetical protein